jgi:hypothetical protein
MIVVLVLLLVVVVVVRFWPSEPTNEERLEYARKRKQAYYAAQQNMLKVSLYEIRQKKEEEQKELELEVRIAISKWQYDDRLMRFERYCKVCGNTDTITRGESDYVYWTSNLYAVLSLFSKDCTKCGASNVVQDTI